MNYRFNHNSINVLDLNKSLAFYKEALGLSEIRRKETKDFILVFLGDRQTNHSLELTWLKNRKAPYDLGEGEFHLALSADDFDASKKKHRDMDCICFENETMGIYFIEDPDGYWIEIIPAK